VANCGYVSQHIMKYGLNIDNEGSIHYVPFPPEQIGTIIECSKFSIRLTDIKIVALCPRMPMPFDSERLFVLFIDKDQNVYGIPDIVLESDEIKKIELYFGLESIREKEWIKFAYSDHNNFKSKIIFPKDLYGQSLYKHPLNSVEAFLAGLKNVLGGGNKTSGVLSDKVKKQFSMH
jgi:hypothetical protein